MASQTVNYLKGSNRNFDNILDSYLNLVDGGTVTGAVTMNGGVNITVEVDKNRILRRIDTGYLDLYTKSFDEAIDLANNAKNKLAKLVNREI